MKIKLARALVYAVLIGAMVFAGAQLGKPTAATTEAACCTYGQDCTQKATPRCCVPVGEGDCSQTQKYYCRLRCS